ncbi:MAG: outer-membrane lipoprotein carrier protein LolA [Dysgonamonadaceae bacterium]|jgi:outer membrane lipoprotein-sorting protein|nr:outer-membrane lipoprotein carrier protein LolA [Dysgonamonadaceae bacterium]
MKSKTKNKTVVIAGLTGRGKRLRVKAAITVAVLLIAGASFAQNKAKDLLDSSSEAFAKAGNLSAAFTIDVKDTQGKQTVAYEGVIDIKDRQFHIQTPDNEIWFNGQTQWVLQKSWLEVNISEPTGQEAQTLHPGNILSIYKKNCKYKYVGEKTDVKMRKVHEIELIPGNKKSEMKKIILQINASDRMPVMFHIYFANQIENLIYIDKYQTNLNLPDSLFVFDAKKYPDAEIIDLR